MFKVATCKSLLLLSLQNQVKEYRCCIPWVPGLLQHPVRAHVSHLADAPLQEEAVAGSVGVSCCTESETLVEAVELGHDIA